MDGALVTFDIESGWFIFGPMQFCSHVYAMIGDKYGYAGAREKGDRGMITERELTMAGRVLGVVR